jgi:UDP-galactopyranose mutase
MAKTLKTGKDLICYSHLRWGFVYQRPQHLMSRFAADRRVFFIEEPEYVEAEKPGIRRVSDRSGVNVVTPLLPRQTAPEKSSRMILRLLEDFFADERIRNHVAWFYTPMALDSCPGTPASTTVYDCMDELSLFRGAPQQLLDREQQLLHLCDLVFTGGVSLYEAKRRRHPHVYAFPSSVDYAHFAQARLLDDTQEDQRHLSRPRIGYAGVIDERIDLDLVDAIAAARPGWQVIMIGPTAKIEDSSLPQRPNIHWLGMKPYTDLPHYFAGWDAAMMPFAINDATKFISPTKTPEYLSAGLPVVSTPVRDVVRGYGESGLARIAPAAPEFIGALDEALAAGRDPAWLNTADLFLRQQSWDRTWKAMNTLIEESETRSRLASHATSSAFAESALVQGTR